MDKLDQYRSHIQTLLERHSQPKTDNTELKTSFSLIPSATTTSSCASAGTA
jgi:hypothetical protein